jgi:hypothetical protein
MKVYSIHEIFILSNEEIKNLFYQKAIGVETLDGSVKEGTVEGFIMNSPIPHYEYIPLICGFKIPSSVLFNEMVKVKIYK